MRNKLPSEQLSQFLDFVSESQRLYKFCSDSVNTQDKLTQDYLHSLELGELSCGERNKLATKLATNRKDRRYYKDRVEELEHIVKFFDDPANKKMLDRMKQVLGQTRKAESYHKDRTYKPRVLKEDMQNELF